ncbi:uncharacterized protein IUM83_09993 [Phytophthora cinnamomi]|uniref:uncharacterized protein n=1 Tax=Phytophthora cinnamomi TaxID=4785 RepID=UPI00355AACE1|nr:hypothetical protein IUM83_09993 [Phytophthora cinnamomi]
MAPVVAFNSERGVDAMLKSWDLVSRWFAGVEMELERLEKDESGSLVASTTTTVTITEHTLRIVFPHLIVGHDTRRRGGSADPSSLAGRLVGQTLVMKGLTRFEWDGAYCRVSSVMSQSDMLTPMLGLVGSLEDVSLVFEGALITPNCWLKPSR